MDKDLLAIQEARDAVRKAKAAQAEFAKFSQAQVDKIVKAMADAGYEAADRLAKMAAEETRMGRYEDKIVKNQFGTRDVYDYIKDMKTVGIIHHDEKRKLYEIAVPMGVVAAIIPTTNPTSTVMYKILITLKSGNGIAIAPHPRAAKCTVEAAEILRKAAEANGAPHGLITYIEHPTLEGTQALMKAPETSVILATGGPNIVREAYSSGKPALGVGSGNVPAFIEKTANVKKAVADIVAGKCFDYGLLCSSENSLVADISLKDHVLTELKNNRAYVCNDDEKAKLQKLMFPTGRLNTEIIGLPAHVIAQRAGLSVPENTTILVVSCKEVGKTDPLSAEKLSPVLSMFFVDGWEAGCELCIKILNFGGIGHTMSIHSTNQDIIMKFGLEKPAFRICVNTVATLGAVGYTTGVAPSMTLGPGTLGGSITTDNIMPNHLINIKRLAFEIRPFTSTLVHGKSQASSATAESATKKNIPAFDSRPKKSGTPSKKTEASVTFGSKGLSEKEIDKIVDEFIKSRR
ncbi:aldehyde dehydrogenase family protein [bacterium]|nr:aldehyde dehydrogenase family protein [bacterium]